MKRYSRLPHRADDDHDDDVEYQAPHDDNDDDPQSSVSIAISRRERQDGTVVRVKQTYLSDGSSRVEERLVSPGPPTNLNIGWTRNEKASFQSRKKGARSQVAGHKEVRFAADELHFSTTEDDKDDDDYSETRRHSLQIWPTFFLEELETVTFFPQYKLSQSSDSRIRFYLALCRYSLFILLIFTLVVSSAWFIMAGDPITYLRKVITKPR